MTKFKAKLLQQQLQELQTGITTIHAALATCHVTISEARFAELLTSKTPGDKLKKQTEGELSKLSKFGKAWGVNLKAKLHKSLRDELDNIVLGA